MPLAETDFSHYNRRSVMTTPDISIRDARFADIPAITRIYAHAVANTVATMDTDEPTLAKQTEWFRHHDERHPVLVATSSNEVVGWASLSAWSDKGGYRGTAEASVYLSPEYHRKGIGTELLQALVRRARAIGLHLLVARISSTNETSLRLARNCGFSDVGTMKESGYKFGGYVDVVVLQLILDASGS
jgi:L-amino acid N-acyltransferase YncA